MMHKLFFTAFAAFLLSFSVNGFTQIPASDSIPLTAKIPASPDPKIADSVQTLPDKTVTQTAPSDSQSVPTTALESADSTLVLDRKDSAVGSVADTQKTAAIPEAPPEVTEELIQVKGGTSPDYRSPRKAGLFSLLVPGLGQYYAHSYKKAAGFAVLEAACFGVMAYFNKKGNDQNNDFLSYHQAHFDSTSYNAWYAWAQTNFSSNNVGLDSTFTMHHSYFNEVMPLRNQQYYEMTSNYAEFAQGWDDVIPTMEDLQNSSIPDSILGYPAEIFNAYLIALVGAEDTIVGFSQNQKTANRKRLDANAEYRKAEWVWYAVLVNHLCSAVDAALTANRNNRTTLGLAPSILDRLHVQSRTYFGAGGSGVPVVNLSLTF